MRFFSLLATCGLVALVAAQDVASTQTSTTSASAATASIDPQIGCLQKCGSADVCCQAACVNVPCPSQLQANATTECAAQCPQGNGTAAETEQYAECQSSCISSYFLTNTATATAAPTGTGPASATATFGDSSATTTGSSGSENSGASGTSSGSAGASATGNSGADTLHVGAVGLGFLGLLVAGLAL